MAGGTHRLVNGVVVRRADRILSACDMHRVTMRAFGRDEAEAYVARFLPLDCVGAYRIEDDADLIERVEGSGADGVIGLPIAVVRDLLARIGFGPQGSATSWFRMR
jgi:septum formation protein